MEDEPSTLNFNIAFQASEVTRPFDPFFGTPDYSCGPRDFLTLGQRPENPGKPRNAAAQAWSAIVQRRSPPNWELIFQKAPLRQPIEGRKVRQECVKRHRFLSLEDAQEQADS
jgi:hypothetical protein